MEELSGEVLRLAREGKAEQEVVQAVKLPKCEGWGRVHGDVRALNVAGMYRHVQAHRRPY
jgi:hypothetical protein